MNARIHCTGNNHRMMNNALLLGVVNKAIVSGRPERLDADCSNRDKSLRPLPVFPVGQIGESDFSCKSGTEIECRARAASDKPPSNGIDLMRDIGWSNPADSKPILKSLHLLGGESIGTQSNCAQRERRHISTIEKSIRFGPWGIWKLHLC